MMGWRPHDYIPDLMAQGDCRVCGCTRERCIQQTAEVIGPSIRAFVDRILHGDEDHRAWLRAAAEAFLSQRPVPGQDAPQD